MPENQVIGEAAIVSIIAATSEESDLGRGTAENMSVPSQELLVNPEPEEPVAQEGLPISSASLKIPEVDVPVETEPELRSTNFISEDKVSTLEVVERDVSPESPEAANEELNDVSIPAAAAESGPEVVEAVVAPVLGTSDSQVQHSVEEMTEVSFTHILSAGSLVDCNKIIKGVNIVEAASESELIVDEGQSLSAMESLPSNSELESTLEPVKVQLEIPEARESDRTAEVELQIIPAIMEEAPAQIDEDKPVLTALQVRHLLSSHLPTDR